MPEDCVIPDLPDPPQEELDEELAAQLEEEAILMREVEDSLFDNTQYWDDEAGEPPVFDEDE